MRQNELRMIALFVNFLFKMLDNSVGIYCGNGGGDGERRG